MNIKDKLSITIKRLNIKYNIFLSLFLIFILIIAFIALTIYSFYTKSLNEMLNKNIDYRRYTVYKENANINELNSIDHIDAVYDDKYLGYIYVYDNVLNIEKLDGTIYLEPVIIENDILSSSKKTIDPSSTGQAFCPKKFYPNSGTYDKIDIFKMLNGKEYINKKFNVENKEFKIIDTYDSDFYYTSKNTCFISFNDYKEISKIRNKNESQGFIIQIDNYKNTKKVLSKLTNYNYEYSAIATISHDEIAPIKNTTGTLVLVSIIITFIASYIIILKKNQSIKKYYYTLKILGYKIKEIKNLSNLELLIIYLLSLLIGSIIFTTIYIIIKYFIATEFLSQSGSFQIPYVLFVLFNVIVVVYMYFINNTIINKTC